MYFNVLNVCAVDRATGDVVDRDQFLTVDHPLNGENAGMDQPLQVSGISGDELAVYAEGPGNDGSLERMGYLVIKHSNGKDWLIPPSSAMSDANDIYLTPDLREKLELLKPSAVKELHLTNILRQMRSIAKAQRSR